MHIAHDSGIRLHQDKEQAKQPIVAFADTIVDPVAVMVPHIDALVALVAVPAAAGLDHLACEADINVLVLGHLFH